MRKQGEERTPLAQHAKERNAVLRVSVTRGQEGTNPVAEGLFGLAVDLNFLAGFGKVVPSKCVGKVELRNSRYFQAHFRRCQCRHGTMESRDL